MYDGIRGGGSYWYSLFFVACVGLGQFVVLNLFLAVLLGNIDMFVSGGRTLSRHRNTRVWRLSHARKVEVTGIPKLILADLGSIVHRRRGASILSWIDTTLI